MKPEYLHFPPVRPSYRTVGYQDLHIFYHSTLLRCGEALVVMQPLSYLFYTETEELDVANYLLILHTPYYHTNMKFTS